MKIFQFGKISFVMVLTLLLCIQTVKPLAVSRPMPINLNLLRGDSEKIYFQIQAMVASDKQSCTFTPSGLEPLIIKFDEPSPTIVNLGEIKNIYGTVTVPQDAPIKTYNGQLVVNCAPSVGDKQTGGSVIHQTLVADFIVSVVQNKEEVVVNPIIIPKIEEKPKASPIILVLIIIVLILAIVGFYFSRKKKIE